MKTVTNNINNPVLIVEDIKTNYEVLQVFLNDINVPSENANDGMEAITMCSIKGSDYYSLILMDINLPLLNGIETANRLRKSGIKAPIIAMTASNKNESIIKKACKTFDSIIFKPFNYLKLYSVLSPYIPNALAYIESTQTGHDESGHEEPGHESGPHLVNSDICDVNTGVSNMGGNTGLFIKHFNYFKQNNVDLALRLKNMLDKCQYKDAALLCHSTKGVAGMLALPSVYSDMIELEDVLKKESSLSENDMENAYNIIATIAGNIRLVCQIQF